MYKCILFIINLLQLKVGCCYRLFSFIQALEIVLTVLMSR